MMSELLARRKAAAENSGATSKEDEKKKRRRQLGRAPSNALHTSNPSTADDLASRANSVVAEERFEGKGYVEYQPSQELGWDAPGAREEREKMIRAMGGKVEESGVMVGPIGVVKDIVSEAGLGRSRKRRG